MNHQIDDEQAQRFEVPPKQYVEHIEPTEAEVMANNKFVVENLEHVDWYIGRLADLDNEADRVKRNAEKRLNQIESEKKSFDFLFGRSVERVAREAIARLKGRKSIILSNGEVAIRHDSGGVEILEPKQALEAAMKIESHRLTRSKVEHSLDTTEFKKFIEREYKALLKSHQGDIEAAEDALREKYPFIKIKPESEKFAVKYETVEAVRKKAEKEARRAG